jgi:hypothetical protein
MLFKFRRNILIVFLESASYSRRLYFTLYLLFEPPFLSVSFHKKSGGSEKKIVLGKVARTIDRSQDLAKQQQTVCGSARAISTSLTPLTSHQKSWPQQNTGNATTDSLGLNSPLGDFAAPFTQFADALSLEFPRRFMLNYSFFVSRLRVRKTSSRP